MYDHFFNTDKSDFPNNKILQIYYRARNTFDYIQKEKKKKKGEQYETKAREKKTKKMALSRNVNCRKIFQTFKRKKCTRVLFLHRRHVHATKLRVNFFYWCFFFFFGFANSNRLFREGNRQL